MKKDDVWPPGFVPQMTFNNDAKKAQAASRARDERARKKVKAWGTNTVPVARPKS